MNCSIVETQKIHLTPEEHALFKELLRPGAEISALIPKDATADELWRTLDACVRGMGMLEARVTRLKPIIGHILIMFENKPSLYKELGYETYSDFMRQGVYDRLGLHRTSAWEGRLAAKEWKQLTPDRYVKIGPKKLNILSKFANGSSPNAELLLQTAERMKVGELRNYAEDRGWIDKGETIGKTFEIPTNLAKWREFDEFFSNPRVHAYVGSKDKDKILQAALQECSVEWQIAGQGQGA